MTHLEAGDPAPDFVAASTVNPAFHFNALGGYRVVLVFFGQPGTARTAALRQVLASGLPALRGQGAHVFGVVLGAGAPLDAEQDGIHLPITLFRDPEGAIFCRYGLVRAEEDAARASPAAFVLDEGRRVVGVVPVEAGDGWLRRVAQLVGTLPPRAAPRMVVQQAPVLIVPNVLSRPFCRRLIDYFEETGGSESGFMREVDGRTVGVVDNRFKRRRDRSVEDEGLRTAIRDAVNRRLCPAIDSAFNFSATRLERYLVARYDADGAGFFKPHRDNTTKGTAHRRFAVTINLNADDYEGGDLRFPEHGDDRYRAATGGAVVFGCGLLHEALPVTRGVRYALLPFLYNEAAEAVRVANLGYLDSDRVIDMNRESAESPAA